MKKSYSRGGFKRTLKPLHSNHSRSVATLVSLLLLVGVFLPASASAASWTDLFSSLRDQLRHGFDIRSGTLQTIPLAQAATNLDPAPAVGGGDITIVDDSALMPEQGPSGTIADIEKPKNGTISTYVVREGDTLSSIAKLFDVTSNTILWANSDLPRGSALRVGQTLVILPVTGVKYTVKKGDTLASIAKKYKGDVTEIASYNGVEDSSLVVGTELIVPDGEIAASVVITSKTVGAEPAHNVGPRGSASEIAYYIAPLSHYVETQGIHGYNAVDLAAPSGTPIMAAAEGDVIVARQGGWNGGYGSYVVIQHNNGSQTLYSHMSKVTTYVGEHVVQGEIIGYVGATGKATGPHVHFEIRNGIRNPF